MNNSKKLFVSITIIALFAVFSTFSVTKNEIKQKLQTLSDAQLPTIDSQVLTTGRPQDDKNTQIKNNFERIKTILKEMIKQQQEALTAQ